MLKVIYIHINVFNYIKKYIFQKKFISGLSKKIFKNRFQYPHNGVETYIDI